MFIHRKPNQTMCVQFYFLAHCKSVWSLYFEMMNYNEKIQNPGVNMVYVVAKCLSNPTSESSYVAKVKTKTIM